MSDHEPAPPPRLPSLTFLGHSTMLIEIAGTRILTDPLVFERLLILRRMASRLDAAHHRDLDAVLISHLHVDHLHIRSLLQLGRETRVIMPAGGERLLTGHGFTRVEGVRPGEMVEVGPVRVTATFAEHDGSRPPFGPKAPALGFVLEEGPTKVYFAGDTDVFPEMEALAPHLDVAMLPVWGWGPRLGHGHMNPRTAALALRHPAASLRGADPLGDALAVRVRAGGAGAPHRPAPRVRPFRPPLRARRAGAAHPAGPASHVRPGRAGSCDRQDAACQAAATAEAARAARDASSVMTVGPTTGSIPRAAIAGASAASASSMSSASTSPV